MSEFFDTEVWEMWSLLHTPLSGVFCGNGAQILFLFHYVSTINSQSQRIKSYQPPSIISQGRESTPDLATSPRRQLIPQAGSSNNNNNLRLGPPPPMVIQDDFRKVRFLKEVTLPCQKEREAEKVSQCAIYPSLPRLLKI